MNLSFITIIRNITNLCCIRTHEHFKRKVISYFYRVLPIIDYMFEYHSIYSNSGVCTYEYFTVPEWTILFYYVIFLIFKINSSL